MKKTNKKKTKNKKQKTTVNSENFERNSKKKVNQVEAVLIKFDHL